MRRKIILLALLVVKSHAGVNCALKPQYEELSTRTVATVADYQKLERDFIALNAAHREHPRHLPPSIQIPTTADNLTAKVEVIQQVASARAAHVCK